MKQEKLEYLQRKYESRLNPAEDKVLTALPRPKGPGSKSMKSMAGGKDRKSVV